MIPSWTQQLRSRVTRDNELPAPKMPTVAGRDPILGLEDFLLYVHRLSATLGDTKIFTDHGIGLAEWAILKNLQNDSPTRIRQIERRTNLPRRRLSKLL